LALRCRIVPLCAADLDNKVVAARLHVNQATVSKWRQRFIARRSDGLADDPLRARCARSPMTWSKR
jgi:transposase-like protein